MRLFVATLLTLFATTLLFFSATPVIADGKSDFEYQYGQYRLFYPEYLVLKRDYLATPSLDNQQKAILSAKQTIVARDLTKASFAQYLLELITGYKVTYPQLQPVVDALGKSRLYFLSEVQKAQALTIEEDIRKFSLSHLKTVGDYDSYLKFGIVAHKIAALVRIQQDSRIALEKLIPKLPDPMPASLDERVRYLKDSSGAIDAKIQLLTTELDLSEAVAESANDIFFTGRVEKIAAIRTLQLDWINRLIDLDLNYGKI